MGQGYTVEVHRHRTEGLQPLTGVVGFSYTDSTEASAVFTVQFKLPLSQVPFAVRVGDWLVVRQRSGVCVAFGHVDTVSGGISVGNDGAVATSIVQAGCSSWFDFLGKSTVYVPLGAVDTRGTLMSFGDWVGLNFVGMVDFWTGSIGTALEKIHRLTARIKLPDSLGGEYIGDAIPIVHNDETRRRYAPLRVVEQVSTVGGLPTQFSFEFANAKLQELYFGSFVPDSSMVEMFPSLEVPAEELDATQQHLVPGPEYRPLSKLAQHLGRNPCLIYRMRPWRARPLIESAVVDGGYPQDADDKLALRVMANPVQTAVEVGANDLTRYKQANLLGEVVAGDPPMFSEVTWDTRRAREVPMSAVRGITFGWDDSRRANCASITLSNSPGTGWEAMKELGLPITNDVSLIENGCRLVKPSWPFTLAKAEDPLWVPYMRSIAAQKMQFSHVGHAMSEGDISLNWRDADGSMLAVQAGEILTIALPGFDQPFYGYAQQVTHDVSTGSLGQITARTTVRYVRGLIGIEAARDAEFLLSASDGSLERIVANRVPVAPIGATSSSTGMLDGSVVVAAARELWLKNYINPTSGTRRPATLALINRLMRTPDGINNKQFNNGADWTHEQYIADQAVDETKTDQRQETNYCGAFSAYCWRAAGLALPLRTDLFASTSKLLKFARYEASTSSASSRWQRPADGTERKLLTLTAGSTAADVDAFGVQPGDILIVGDGTAAKRSGSHIAIIESWDSSTGLFTTYEGNGSPGRQLGAYPSGDRTQVFGVVHRTRPVGNHGDFFAMYVIRPSVHDLGEP